MMAAISATSASVASRSEASSPSTYRRVGVCPARTPTLSRLAIPSIGGQVLGEGLEGPVDALDQGVEGHALDVLQRAGDGLAVLGAGRGDPEPAVADDHAGHAVPARRRQVRVPQDLGVVVGVDVDEARGPARGRRDRPPRPRRRRRRRRRRRSGRRPPRRRPRRRGAPVPSITVPLRRIRSITSPSSAVRTRPYRQPMQAWIRPRRTSRVGPSRPRAPRGPAARRPGAPPAGT